MIIDIMLNMRKKLIFIVSIIVSVLFPFILLFILYSLMNFINYIYVNKIFEFINSNKLIIICLLLFIILSIIIFKYNLSGNYLTESNYINLALVGQLTNCLLIICLLIILFFQPFIPLILFHFAVSQTYLYGLFEGVMIPIIINILLLLLVTIISIIASSIMPIIYTKKVLLKLEEKKIIIDNKIENINQFKILIKIIKIRKEVKKCPTFA